MGRQLSLFETQNAVTASIAGFDAVVKAAMNQAAAASSFSRPQLVDRMNELTRASGVRLTQGNARSISLDTLEKWLNPESPQVPTTRAVHVFMLACGSVAPLEAWAGLHGCPCVTCHCYCPYCEGACDKMKAWEEAGRPGWREPHERIIDPVSGGQ